MSTKDAINELDRVVLTEDLPEHHLKAGDMGTVVYVHDSGAGFQVEFMTLTGTTMAVTFVRADQVRPTTDQDVPHARVRE